MSKEWFIYIVLAAAVAGTVFALRGMNEEWLQEASVLAGTIHTVVEKSKECFKV